VPFKEYLAIGGLWLGWCVVHSLLNSDGPIRKTGIMDTSAAGYYRFFYTVFAVVSLLLVSWLTPRHHQVTVWTWDGAFKPGQIGLWIVGGIIAFLAFRFFSGWSFLGLDAFGLPGRRRASEDVLITWGIYGSIRHPQFVAGLIFLWSKNLNDTDLIVNLILSGYLLIGAHIEEKRLLAKWDDRYRCYMERTGRFIPKSIPSIDSLFAGKPP
jgi:methanethiol S-methyltransferase